MSLIRNSLNFFSSEKIIPVPVLLSEVKVNVKTISKARFLLQCYMITFTEGE